MFRKFLWVFIEKGAMMTIQFVALLILSKLLSPTEFGIYGIMLIFISVSDILVDSGFGGAIIQKRNLSQSDIDTLFLTNLVIAATLYISIFAFADLIETFYEVDSLASYLRIISLAIVFYSFSIVQNSMMMRNLQFRKLAVISVASSFFSSLIAILLAYMGCGVWALVLQQVFMSLFLAGFLWIFSKVHVSLKYSKKSFSDLWAFGSNLLFANLLSSFYNNISSSIVPKISTLVQAGYFNQARRLQLLPNNIINMSIDKATFPILSKEKSEALMIEQARVINRYIVTICAPLFPTLSLMSYAITNVLLGTKWIPAATYLSVLFWAGFGLLIQGLYRNMFKSAGYTKVVFKIEIFNTIVGITILLLGIFGGIMMIVYGIVFSSILSVALWMFYAKTVFSYTYLEQIKDVRPAICISIIYYCFCLFIKYFITDEMVSSLLGINCILLYIVIAYLSKNQEIQNLFQIISNYVLRIRKE